MYDFIVDICTAFVSALPVLIVLRIIFEFLRGLLFKDG